MCPELSEANLGTQKTKDRTHHSKPLGPRPLQRADLPIDGSVKDSTHVLSSDSDSEGTLTIRNGPSFDGSLLKRNTKQAGATKSDDHEQQRTEYAIDHNGNVNGVCGVQYFGLQGAGSKDGGVRVTNNNNGEFGIQCFANASENPGLLAKEMVPLAAKCVELQKAKNQYVEPPKAKKQYAELPKAKKESRAGARK